LAILQSLRDELTARLAETDAALADQSARADTLAGQLARTTSDLGEQRRLSSEAERKVDLLNRQLASLRRQLATLAEALEVSEAKSKEQQAQIADLGRRLNVALVNKVQELARYRSEFFGRLREALGEHPDIRVVGDRFVFQSEVLFDTASAELEAPGKEQLARLAQTLLDIGKRIPEDLDWVLRVDGHTDRRPISTPEFPSNWELSTARAISVVQFLIDQGVPAKRLVAAGFGQYNPLEAGADEISFRRNRRIELKLTER
jgi:chemotaxis protein MotB